MNHVVALVRRVLTALCLAKPEHRAWALYDWANSAYVTTVVTAVFPVYYSAVVAADLPAAEATRRFAVASTVALVLAAVSAPFLGALADRLPIKKKLLGAFAVLGVLSTVGLFWVGRGDRLLADVLFVFGNIGLMGSFVFYDALLPHVASEKEVDRLSSAGYALGYLGGGLLLFLNLFMLQKPQAFGLNDTASASRVSFLAVAVWWAVFSIPLFRKVPEPSLTGTSQHPFREAWERLIHTVSALRSYPAAALLLAAYFFYNDGIGTMYRMAAIYGAELGLNAGALLLTLAVTNIVSIPFAFAFGVVAAKVGAKRALLGSLVVYIGISVGAFFLRTELHFFVLAMTVALVQGGAQALSRSLFATLIPRDRTAQFFGLFGVTDKVSGVFGPLVFALVGSALGSSRYAVMSVALFFILGGGLLAFVNVEEGRVRAVRGACINGRS